MRTMIGITGIIMWMLCLLAVWLLASLTAEGLHDISGLPHTTAYFFGYLVSASLAGGQIVLAGGLAIKEDTRYPLLLVILAGLISILANVFAAVAYATDASVLEIMIRAICGILLALIVAGGAYVSSRAILHANWSWLSKSIKRSSNKSSYTSLDQSFDMEPALLEPAEIVEETLGAAEPIVEEVVSVAEPDESVSNLTDAQSVLEDVSDSASELPLDDDEIDGQSENDDEPDVVQVLANTEHMSISLSDKGILTLGATVTSRKKMKKLRTKLSQSIPNGVIWVNGMESVGDHSYTLTGSLKRKANRGLIVKQLKEFAYDFQSS